MSKDKKETWKSRWERVPIMVKILLGAMLLWGVMMLSWRMIPDAEDKSHYKTDDVVTMDDLGNGGMKEDASTPNMEIRENVTEFETTKFVDTVSEIRRLTEEYEGKIEFDKIEYDELGTRKCGNYECDIVIPSEKFYAFLEDVKHIKDTSIMYEYTDIWDTSNNLEDVGQRIAALERDIQRMQERMDTATDDTKRAEYRVELDSLEDELEELRYKQEDLTEGVPMSDFTIYVEEVRQLHRSVSDTDVKTMFVQSVKDGWNNGLLQLVTVLSFFLRHWLIFVLLILFCIVWGRAQKKKQETVVSEESVSEGTDTKE